MKEYLEKIKLIYLPFLATAISFMLIYNFIYWLLFIRLEAFSIRESFLTFCLPFLLSWIPVYFLLKPRLKLLKLKNGNTGGLQLLSILIIALSTIHLKEYLIVASSKLTDINIISDIQKHEKSKYYSLKKIYIDKKNIGVVNTNEVYGKYNQNLYMSLYVAMPILEATNDTSKYECKYWLGKKYSSSTNNWISDTKKQIIFKKFIEQVEDEFKNTDFNKFTYLELVGNTDDHDNFDNAIKKSSRYNSDKPILLVAHQGSHEDLKGTKTISSYFFLIVGYIIWLIILTFIKFQPKNKRISFRK